MKIIFGSVIYPEAIKYFEEFYNSVLKQTFQEFDFVLINDGVKELPKMERQVTVLNGQVNSIVGLRLQLLDYAIYHSYDLLIIGDSDDYFHNRRVENTVKEFDTSYGFFYNDILNIDGSDYFHTQLPKSVETIKTIEQYNFLGLSNTAINVSFIKKYRHLYRMNDVIAFDWYLFSILLLHGVKGKYIKNASTYYRAYNGNYSNQSNNSKMIEIELNVKEKHFEQLKEFNPLYEKYYHEIIEIKNGLIETKLNMNKSGYWWENIIIGDESFENR